MYLIEILHQTTTRGDDKAHQYRLYLIEILHQTTTGRPRRRHRPGVVSYRNSTSNHNLRTGQTMSRFVVSYRNSTSNHNGQPRRCPLRPLYLIEILHQTTTFGDALKSAGKLYLIEILHQTTTMQKQSELSYGCILSKFYIKPQP